ncbi:MAG: hypothetical protein KJN93_00485 [Alphaproteobacteria bacterium]|nr:hypothetical protein [Alphaproteobacteria bacterium]
MTHISFAHKSGNHACFFGHRVYFGRERGDKVVVFTSLLDWPGCMPGLFLLNGFQDHREDNRIAAAGPSWHGSAINP